MGGLESGCVLLLINFVCLQAILSRLAVSQCLATPGATGVPDLCPCLAVPGLWVLGKARLLLRLCSFIQGIQASPGGSSNFLLPDALSSSDWRFRHIPTPCSEEDHVINSTSFHTPMLPGRAQIEPCWERGLEGCRPWTRIPEVTLNSCHSFPFLRADCVPKSLRPFLHPHHMHMKQMFLLSPFYRLFC